MRDSKSSGEKTIKEVPELRARKPRLERVSSDVAGRKKTEKKLRQSEQRFRSIFDNANDVIGFVNTTGKIIEVNKKVADILGYKPDELIGKNFMKCGILPIKNAPRIIRLFKELVKRRGLFDVEGDGRNVIQLALRHKKGHSVFVEASTKAIKTDGKLEGFLSVLRDITERKTAEHALKESEEKYRQIVELAPEGILTVDLKGMITSCNTALLEETGYSKDDFVGRHVSKIPTARLRDIPKYIKMFNSSLRGNVPEPFESEWIHKDGTEHWSEAYVGVLKRHGKTTGFQVITRDITDRKRAEEVLRESEQKLRLLFEGAYDLISLADADCKTLWANPAWKKIFGAESEYQADPFSCIHPDDLERVAKSWQNLISRAVPIKNLVYRYKIPEGQYLTFESCAYPVVIGQQKLYYVVARDITERKKTEEALRNINKCFLSFSSNPDENIDKIVKTAGFVLQGTCALYNKEKGALVCTTGGWNIPEDLKREDRKVGHICYDVITKHEDEPIVVNNLDKTQYAQTDPNVVKYGLKTYIGCAVKVGHKAVGALCVVYREDKTFGSNELKILSILAKALGVEEERKKAEEALRESEKTARAILNATYDLAFLIDTEGTMLALNETFAKRFGKRVDELIGSCVYDLLPPDVAARRKAQADNTIRSGQPLRFEDVRQGRHLDSSVYPVFDANGRVERLAVFSSDITERKRAEEEIRKFKTICDRAGYGVAMSDIKGNLIYVNRSFAQMHGYTADELIGKNLSFFHNQEQMKNVNRLNDKLRREGRFIAEEVWHKRKDDSVFPTLMNGTLIRDERQKPLFMAATAVDITDRKQAEQKLRESEQRLKILFEYAPDGIYLNDLKGNFVDGNKAAEELVGFKREELIGKNLAEVGLLSAGETPKALANLEKVAHGEPTGPDEFTLQRKDGNSISVEIRAFPVRIKDEILSLGIARDITERKNAEQRLLREQAKLKSLTSQLTLAEERERRRIATELHDRIGQSLVISKMNLEALRKSEYGKKTDETLDEICNSLAQTIADTRTLTFDLSSPVLYQLGFEMAVAEWLTEEIRDKHGIASEFEDDGRPKPLGDDIGVLLFRNVRELLINVVKHARAHKVKVAIRKVGKKIQVSVEDDGVGFDPAEAASTAAKKAEFGLFSIQQRLEELGGHLEIECEPGRGCMVTMTAPLKQR